MCSVLLCSVDASLPSGKRLHSHGNHHFYWENSLFLWAMLQYDADSIDVNLAILVGIYPSRRNGPECSMGGLTVKPSKFSLQPSTPSFLADLYHRILQISYVLCPKNKGYTYNVGQPSYQFVYMVVTT